MRRRSSIGVHIQRLLTLVVELAVEEGFGGAEAVRLGMTGAELAFGNGVAA